MSKTRHAKRLGMVAFQSVILVIGFLTGRAAAAHPVSFSVEHAEGAIGASPKDIDVQKDYPKQLGENVELLAFNYSRLGAGDEYEMTFAFRTNVQLDKDYYIFVHGEVDKSHVNNIPKPVGKATQLQKWVFMPDPPTSRWSPEEVIVVKNRVKAALVAYNMDVNLLLNDPDEGWQSLNPEFVQVGCHAAFSQEEQGLIEEYDRILAFLDDDNPLVDRGYIISGLGGLHEYDLELVPITENTTFVNAPAGSSLQTVDTVLERWVLISDDLKSAFFSTSRNFSRYNTCRPGEEIPGVRDWYLYKITESRMVLRYAYVHNNCYTISSLVDMYTLTSEQKYLDQARRICYHLIDRIYEDGKFRRHFSGLPPEYNGMNQAYVMRSLYEYHMKDPSNTDIKDALIRLAEGYEFSAEGTWNHWHNAMMGHVLRDRILDRKAEPDFGPPGGPMQTREEYAKGWLLELGRQVREFSGEVPRVMKRTHPEWPLFKVSYQPYETMLMVKLVSEYLNDDNYRVHEFFPEAMRFTEKVYSKGNSRYRACVEEAKYHALRAFGWIDEEYQEEFYNYCSSFRETPPKKGTNDVVHRLRCISLYLMYRSIHSPGAPSGDVDRDEIPDEWEVRHLGTIQRASEESDLDGDGLSDLDESHHGTNPLSSDSDADGIPDKIEVELGLKPSVADGNADYDGDGKTNLDEWNQNTNPIDGPSIQGNEIEGKPRSTLLLHLTMNDNTASPTVLDVSVGHQDQTFVDPGGDPNTDAHSVPGVGGTALAFDGVDDSIVIPEAQVSHVFAADTDFSVAFWWRSDWEWLHFEV